MAKSFERYLRSQDVPRKCPKCGEPASTQRKVRPFCGVAHRTQYTNEQRKVEFERFLASLAEVGDLTDNDGVVCCVKKVDLKETKEGKGFSLVVRYDAVHTMWCGQAVDYPKMEKGAILTCIGCISQGAQVRCLST